MAGTVTSEPAGASDWSYAQINRPLTTGDQLWNDEGARSELHVGSTAVRLGSSTVSKSSPSMTPAPSQGRARHALDARSLAAAGRRV